MSHFFVTHLYFPHEIAQKTALWTEAGTASAGMGVQLVELVDTLRGKNAM